MYNHPIRKFAGLVVLYTIIIIGLFVLQFRSESAFSRNIGFLRISLQQNVDEKGNTELLNTVKASYKGITFTADDSTPAILKMRDSSEHNLKLLTWDQKESSFELKFTENVVLTFAVTGTSSSSSLNVSAVLPHNASSLLLSYKPDSSYTVTADSSNLVTLESKNLTYKMSGPAFDGGYASFSSASPALAYTYQEPPKQVKTKTPESKTFTFASLPKTSPAASPETFLANIAKFRSNFLTQATPAITSGSNLSEKVIAAYVAEMGSNNRFTEAVSSVPDSFKKGSDRTYFTAPYFNSLVAMNPSLVKENDRISLAIRNAIGASDLNIFADSAVALFMLRNNTLENVVKLSNMPASIESFDCDLTQATGLLATYSELKKAKSSLAENLVPVLNKCVEEITACSKLALESFTLKENDVQISFTQTIKTAVALINYGTVTSNEDCKTAGYMLANTAFSQTPVANLSVAADLYPLLASDNNYYPHFQISGKTLTGNVWTWTCAGNITYEESEDHSESFINIDFGLGDSHYVILRGIKPFTDIRIYGIPFHTDGRFESYNSSGYVYNANSNTLYLKSRHKSARELVHLIHKKKPAEQSVTVPAPAAATPAPVESPAAPSAEPEKPSEMAAEYTAIPEE